MAKIMTVKEVAEHLHISRLTIYKMVKNGRMPAFRIGTDYRFDAEAIDRWTKAGGDGGDITKDKP